MPLTTADRERLVRLLGMLGSEHPGERSNAGALADRLLRARGLTWADLIPVSAEEAGEDDAGDDHWRELLAEATRFPGLLSPWERDFVRTLRGFRTLSARQLALLEQIVRKVRCA